MGFYEITNDVISYCWNLVSDDKDKDKPKKPADSAHGETVPLTTPKPVVKQATPQKTGAFSSLSPEKPHQQAQIDNVFDTAKKGATVSNPPAAATPAAPKQNAPAQAARKIPESIDTFLCKYSPEYKKATEEHASRKVKDGIIEKYLLQVRDPEKRHQIFEELRQKGCSKEEIHMLGKLVHVLNAKYQMQAANDIMHNNRTEELNRAGRRGIAESIQDLGYDTGIDGKRHYRHDLRIQAHATNAVLATKDPEAISIAAANVSKTDKSEQVGIVKSYQGIQDKNLNVAANKLIINQYGEFAKDNQLAIHQIMSNSQYSEVIRYAATNIYQFQDKKIREEAYRITSNTGDQEAIQEAKQACDEANSDDCDDDDDDYSDDSDTQSSQQTTQEQASLGSQGNPTTIEEVNDFSEALLSARNSISQGEIVNNASDTIKIFLAQTTSSISVLAALIQNSPSRDLFSAVINNLSNMPDGPDKKALILQLNQSGALTEDVMKNNPSLQMTVMMANNDTKGIKRVFLSAAGKGLFDKIEEEKQRQQGNLGIVA